MKQVSLVIWVDPSDCDAPHPVRKEERLYPLVEAFRKDGFNLDHPALVGYVLNGRIQLLSGTHRHRSAEIAGIKLPVTLWLGSDIDQNWGTLEEWVKIMKDIPVRKLQQIHVEDFRARGYLALE